MNDDERPYALSFWFEWHAESAFWTANAAARAHFGLGEIDLDALPLREETRERVRALADWHDTSLNWDYPPDPGPWRQEECDRFNAAVEALFRDVTHELGPRYQLTNAQPALHEDPDLDAYLRDPKGFRRLGGDRR